MEKYGVLSLISIFVLCIVNVSGGFSVPVKATPPQYIGLGEFQNPVQGINFTLPQKEALNPDVPVIKHAYALDRGKYGTILKIYIEAEDPRGDMAKIATTVDEVGYGHYPTDFITLKPAYGKDFKGYIQWNTFGSHASQMEEWTQVYVTVAVIDKAGKTSNEFVFPFTFETGVAPVSKPPMPFDQEGIPKLGYVSIDLFRPNQGGHGGNGRKDLN